MDTSGEGNAPTRAGRIAQPGIIFHARVVPEPWLGSKPAEAQREPPLLRRGEEPGWQNSLGPSVPLNGRDDLPG